MTEIEFPSGDTIDALITNIVSLDIKVESFRKASGLLPDLKLPDITYMEILAAINAGTLCKDYLLGIRVDLENTLFLFDTYIRNAYKIKKGIENEYNRNE